MSLNKVSNKLTTEIINDIFNKVGGKNVINWEFEDGTNNKGDSYLSEIFRIKISGIDLTGNGLSTNVIIKSIPKSIARKITFRSVDFFRNEIRFYTKVIPMFEEFQRMKNIVPFDDFPLCLAAYCDGDNDFIALEDLSFKDYKSGDRHSGLDIEHCRFIMKTLGNFHALSFAMKDQQPKRFLKIAESLEETNFHAKYRDWYRDFIKIQIEVAADCLAQEYPNTYIEEKFKQFVKDDFYGKMVKLVSSNNKYSVITIADCWTPNFLFKYNSDGSVLKRVKLIDFQFARYVSPAQDISFFFYSCTSQDLREKYFDELLKIYHENLSNTVKLLGSNPEKLFPFSALENEMKESARFGCGTGMESLPFSIMDDSETSDLDAIQGTEPIPITDICVLKKITSKEGRLRIADMFKHAADRGYLD